jgi:hypothetical protein
MKPGPTQPPLLSEADRQKLIRLEEDMWREETRHDTQFMQQHLASDFFEFGRSGRIYTLKILCHFLRWQSMDIKKLDVVQAKSLLIKAWPFYNFKPL